MRKSIKQLISVVLAVSIIAISVSPLGAFAQDMDINLSYESPLDGFNVNISENTAYSVDFTQLVKNGADTTYGSATDIINLDDYTTAYLTYAGTYVDASGVVHLTGS